MKVRRESNYLRMKTVSRPRISSCIIGYAIADLRAIHLLHMCAPSSFILMGIITSAGACSDHPASQTDGADPYIKGIIGCDFAMVKHTASNVFLRHRAQKDGSFHPRFQKKDQTGSDLMQIELLASSRLTIENIQLIVLPSCHVPCII